MRAYRKKRVTVNLLLDIKGNVGPAVMVYDFKGRHKMTQSDFNEIVDYAKEKLNADRVVISSYQYI
ncbi:hypothetical protein EauS123_00027 [Exiguobacterium phage vB_EauS-123]|nr:hypothetical protein EauS123_00027 [Exiguobacterium phage vB_EauS-123]